MEQNTNTKKEVQKQSQNQLKKALKKVESSITPEMWEGMKQTLMQQFQAREKMDADVDKLRWGEQFIMNCLLLRRAGYNFEIRAYLEDVAKGSEAVLKLCTKFLECAEKEDIIKYLLRCEFKVDKGELWVKFQWDGLRQLLNKTLEDKA